MRNQCHGQRKYFTVQLNSKGEENRLIGKFVLMNDVSNESLLTGRIEVNGILYAF